MLKLAFGRKGLQGEKGGAGDIADCRLIRRLTDCQLKIEEWKMKNEELRVKIAGDHCFWMPALRLALSLAEGLSKGWMLAGW